MKTVKKDISFGFLLSDVTRLFRKHFDRRAVEFGLTRAQWRALKWLNASEGMNQSELAEQLEMEPMAIGRVIDRLQNSGFVVRKADPSDRRSWRLFLTDRARAILDDMQRISKKLLSEAVGDIPKDDIDHTLQVLERIKSNLLELESR
ncbi:MAG: MarR family transcriptional regulator [Lysobacterales bacterium]